MVEISALLGFVFRHRLHFVELASSATPNSGLVLGRSLRLHFVEACGSTSWRLAAPLRGACEFGYAELGASRSSGGDGRGAGRIPVHRTVLGTVGAALPSTPDLRVPPRVEHQIAVAPGSGREERLPC